MNIQNVYADDDSGLVGFMVTIDVTHVKYFPENVTREEIDSWVKSEYDRVYEANIAAMKTMRQAQQKKISKESKHEHGDD